MRLATAQAVLGVVGTQVSSGSIDTANAALDATYSIVEDALETKLVRGRRTDYFDLSRSEVSYPRLRLECGFVSKEEPFVVQSEGQTLLEGVYDLEPLSGVVCLDGVYPVGRKVLSVTYSYGFEVSYDDESQLQGVEQGVVQAGLSLAATFLMLNPANIAKEKARFLAAVSVNGFEIKARQACAQFTRPRGTVLWPSFSKVIE